MMLSLWIPQGLTADADRGQTLTQTCIACHGADGNSIAGSFPSIAGQNERYLLKQLREIKSGARAALLMVGQLDSMSDQERAGTGARRSKRRFGPGVAAANHNDIVMLRVSDHCCGA